MELLDLIYTELRQGNLNIVFPNAGKLNQYAKMYFNMAKDNINLTPEQIKDLDLLIRICNILYNCTDMNPLPIEDGVYDIILEYYKKYNPNYQVGSDVIAFKPTDNLKKTVTDKKKVNPFIYYNKDEIERQKNGFFYNDLTLVPNCTIEDFEKNTNPLSNEIISKRTHTVAHNHPDLVGTLDKSKFVLMKDAMEKGVANDTNVKVLERDFFADHIQRGIIDPEERFSMMLELKYDGISVEADCTDQVISARTRGDTGAGVAADITPILAGYSFPKAREVTEDLGCIGIKFEAIMTYSDLARFNQLRGTNYANCRTAIVGLFGSSDAPKYRDFITLIPLAVDKDDVPAAIMENRELEIEFLNRFYSTKGHRLAASKIEGDYKTCLYLIKAYQEEAEIARSRLDFMYDGIVVSYNEPVLRNKLGRVNYVNKYSMAVKFNPLVRQTRFLGYSYTVGQDGSITPMIHYEPVEFFGTIHDKSTGNSYARFKSLNLAIGDIVNVEYVNDVMPRVSSYEYADKKKNPNPKEKFIEVCPVCGTPLIFSESSARCPNLDCPGREIPRMINMLNKLGIKGFAEASISAINCHSLVDLYALDRNTAMKILGENGDKLVGLLTAVANIPTPKYTIIGALGFTGIAQGSWEAIMKQYTLKELLDAYTDNTLYRKLLSVPGIAEKSATVICNEFPRFLNDLKFIAAMPTFFDTKNISNGKSVRFTGVSRDKDFISYLVSKGYDAKDGSVTSTTDILCVPYEGFTSSKTAKAKNARIVTQQDFMVETGYMDGTTVNTF